MFLDNNIYLGLAEGERVYLPLNMATRHGLVAARPKLTVTVVPLPISLSMAKSPPVACAVILGSKSDAKRA
ncbi:hypothetical protein [Anaerotignum sp.]